MSGVTFLDEIMYTTVKKVRHKNPMLFDFILVTNFDQAFD